MRTRRSHAPTSPHPKNHATSEKKCSQDNVSDLLSRAVLRLSERRDRNLDMAAGNGNKRQANHLSSIVYSSTSKGMHLMGEHHSKEWVVVVRRSFPIFKKNPPADDLSSFHMPAPEATGMLRTDSKPPPVFEQSGMSRTCPTSQSNGRRLHSFPLSISLSHVALMIHIQTLHICSHPMQGSDRWLRLEKRRFRTCFETPHSYGLSNKTLLLRESTRDGGRVAAFSSPLL